MPPAARMGDNTAHGGVIVLGHPTTIIGGQPAARISDMHTCPMVTGVVPHVGGPIIKGSPTVIIGGMPAARIGDQLTCTGPPDVIVAGHPTTMNRPATGARAGPVAGAAKSRVGNTGS